MAILKVIREKWLRTTFIKSGRFSTGKIFDISHETVSSLSLFDTKGKPTTYLILENQATTTLVMVLILVPSPVVYIYSPRQRPFHDQGRNWVSQDFKKCYDVKHIYLRIKSGVVPTLTHWHGSRQWYIDPDGQWWDSWIALMSEYPKSFKNSRRGFNGQLYSELK